MEILPPLNDGADDDQGEGGGEEGGGRESERNIFPRYSVRGLCIYVYVHVHVYVYMNLQVQVWSCRRLIMCDMCNNLYNMLYMFLNER